MAEIIVKDTPIRRAWRRFAQFVVVSLAHLLYRVEAEGAENIPADGPLLVVSNHQSYIDPIFCQDRAARRFLFVARENLYRGFFGALLRSLYTIPIKQGQGDLAAMKAIIKVIEQGNVVCLYPEGSRTLDGKLDEIKPGISLISRRSGAPVLPMTIEGAHEAWARSEKRPRFWQPVRVKYGKPVSAEHIKEIGDAAFARELTETFQNMQNELRVKMGRKPFAYALPEGQGADE